MNLIKFIGNRLEDSAKLAKKERPEAPYVQDVKSLSNYYKPSKGIISNWWQQTRSVSRQGLIKALTKEELLVIEHAAILEDAARQDVLKKKEFKRLLKEHELLFTRLKSEIKRTKQAAKLGLPISAHTEVIKEKYTSRIRVKEQHELSQIEVDTHRQKAEIDLKIRVDEAHESMRLAFLGKALGEHQKIFMIQELVTQARREKDLVQGNVYLLDKTKKDLMKDWDNIIKALKEDMSARQAGLSQINQRKIGP